MFYYLSFLRPPPVQAHPSLPVAIAPQVSNDLRTQLWESELEIYYRWLRSENAASLQDLARAPNTGLLKLTTWRKANAYKDIRVPPPRQVKEGERYRLMLCAKVAGSMSLDLSLESFGVWPFPVLSLPILFSPKFTRATTGVKQDQIQRIYRFPSSINPAVMVIREYLSFELDKKIWDSGVGLAYWLTAVASRTYPAPDIEEALFKGPKKTILELGAGTGIASITLATLIAGMPGTPPTRIFATDLPGCLDLIRHNIQSNSHLFPDVDVRPLLLDWDEEYTPYDLQNGVDIILMADVTYNTSSFPALVNTLYTYIRLKREPPVVIFAYKERDIHERSLFKMTDRIDLKFTEVARLRGAGQEPIEIFVGRVVKEPAPPEGPDPGITADPDLEEGSGRT